MPPPSRPCLSRRADAQGSVLPLIGVPPENRPPVPTILPRTGHDVHGHRLDGALAKLRRQPERRGGFEGHHHGEGRNRARSGAVSPRGHPRVTRPRRISRPDEGHDASAKWRQVSTAVVTMGLGDLSSFDLDTQVAPDISRLLDSGEDQPLGHDLLREAWNIHESNPRSAVAIAGSSVSFAKQSSSTIPWSTPEKQTSPRTGYRLFSRTFDACSTTSTTTAATAGRGRYARTSSLGGADGSTRKLHAADVAGLRLAATMRAPPRTHS